MKLSAYSSQPTQPFWPIPIFTQLLDFIVPTRFEKFCNRHWMKTGICENCKDFKYCQGNGIHLREEGSDEVILCHLNLLESAT